MLRDKNVYSLSEEYYTLKIFQVYLFKYFTFKIENESILTKQNIRPPGLRRLILHELYGNCFFFFIIGRICFINLGRMIRRFGEPKLLFRRL